MKLTEKDITGPVAREIREKAGLTQSQFWKPIGVQQSVGCRYEKDMPIPQSVRILIVANYVAGVKIDTATSEGVADLERLGNMQAKDRDLKKSAARAMRALDSAAAEIAGARETIQSI